MNFRKYSLRQLLALTTAVVAVVASFKVFVLPGIQDALEHERGLQAALFTIRLVDQYIGSHNSWPDCWEDLAAEPGINSPHFDWPKDMRVVEELVEVEFGLSKDEILAQLQSGRQLIRMRGAESSSLESHYKAHTTKWANELRD